MSVITVDNLRKYYGDPSTGSGRGVKAVDGISFEVQRGEIFGFLGPNGAGKTTTIEIIEGYNTPDSGSVTVLGLDPRRDGYALKERIGIMLQETALYQDLRVGEILRLFASYYRDPADPDALLEMIGLEEKQGAFVHELSGGQRQRLAFILTLINDPELLFLDEPTAGLDPQARRALWEWIRLAREKGKTVFLTTHYIEEAENLCDRVAIIDHGRIIALNTPRRLIAPKTPAVSFILRETARAGFWVFPKSCHLAAGLDVKHRIEFVTDGAVDSVRLGGISGVDKALEASKGEFVLYVQETQSVLRELMALAERDGLALRDLRVEGATLEDVFIRLTGRRIRE